jgi:hypothetical protein
MNRRELLQLLGASGVAAGLGEIGNRQAGAQSAGESSGFESHVIAGHEVLSGRACPSIVDGKVIQPRRELPVLHKTDVLVIGAGPAGISAAIAAKRTGADVTLVERYGHFGGLWTGGLVLIITGHIVRGGKQVCQGIGEEMMRRLDKLDGAIINRRPGVDPTVDAEAVKYLMVEMVEEAGVRVFLHCWGADAIMNENTVCGAALESSRRRSLASSASPGGAWERGGWSRCKRSSASRGLTWGERCLARQRCTGRFARPSTPPALGGPRRVPCVGRDGSYGRACLAAGAAMGCSHESLRCRRIASGRAGNPWRDVVGTTGGRGDAGPPPLVLPLGLSHRTVL